MKIRLVYTPEEREEAATVLAALQQRYPGARVHTTTIPQGFYIAYLKTKKGP